VSKFHDQTPKTTYINSVGCLVRDVPTTLNRGRMEGWVRIRIAGQTDWKRMWMVATACIEGERLAERPPSSSGVAGGVLSPNTLTKKKRMSTFFSRDSVANSQPIASSKPNISLYTSPKPKDKKKPLLTIHNVTQAFAVYPERPELISRSTLIKIEGLFGGEDTAAAMKSREGWLLMMPELEGGLRESAEMLKWVVGESDPITAFAPSLISLRQLYMTLLNCMDVLNPGHGILVIPSPSCLGTQLARIKTYVPSCA